MSNLIQQIFGTAFSETEYKFPSGTPIYLSHGYNVRKSSYNDKCFLLISPVEDVWNIGTIKKHMQKIEQISGMPCVIDLPRLTAGQRTNLIESHIAFVSGNNQVFLPFLGCYFENRIAEQEAAPEVMGATSQLVFLYLIYNIDANGGKMNLTQLTRVLNISKSTCTRAVKQLLALELITAENIGVVKWLRLPENRQKLMKRAFTVMRSPISKTIYVKEVPDNIPFLISGVKALSEISMIAAHESDAGIAIDSTFLKKIKKESQISYQDYLDFGGYIIEVWNYDPLLLSDNEWVDELSLLLELNDDVDDRIQNCLDEIRNKYGIEVEEVW